MTKVRVSLNNNPYTISIGPGISKQISRLIKPFDRGGKILVVTDTNIKRVHAAFLKTLSNNKTHFFFLKPGEAAKSFSTVARILDFMLKKGFDRTALILTVGGGVAGDVGGFAAAIYMRGISFVQVPTTLLAQVDASIGGKTGVNHPMGKNLIGSFFQPRAVIVDINFLKTLKPSEFRNCACE